MKVVYTAGRFRGKTSWDVVQNVRRAEEAALRLAELGTMPLCPHMNTANFDGLLTGRFWLDGTRELLRRSDAVYVFDRQWRESEGTVGEMVDALDRDVPLFFTLEQLPRWRDGQTFALGYDSGALRGECVLLLEGFEEAAQ